jgi:hypothetical protein
VVSAILKSPYAASCHVVELSATTVHVSDVSEIAVHVSDVSGTAPHPNPINVPTEQAVCTPIIATDMLFVAEPTEPVAPTPVIAWKVMTSDGIVCTAPVAEFPVTARSLLVVTEPTEVVDALPTASMVNTS